MVPEADPLRQNPQCGFSLTLWLSGHYSLVGLGCYCYNHLLIYLFITQIIANPIWYTWFSG